MAHWRPEQVREHIRSFMGRRNLNVHSWSQRAGVSESALRAFLKGDSDSLTLATAAELAGVEGAAIAELIGENSATRADTDPNLRLIYEILVAVEQFCQEAREELPPEDLARLVVTLYSMHPPTDKPYQLPDDVRNVIFLRRRA